MKYFHFVLIIVATQLMGCIEDKSGKLSDVPTALATASQSNNPAAPDPFKEYWYGGKAEINSYKLEQARYGEMRDGEAVLVFVSEPFSKSKQVKLDNPNSKKDKLPVLKMNALRKFNTGIYDYSIMRSVFTPIQLEQYPKTVKLNMSSQEWCGQVYTQYNLLDKNKYRVSGLSYFESEGDEDFEVTAALLEDELFNRIRLQADALHKGDFDLIPSLIYSRLLHKPMRPTRVRASIKEIENGKRYVVEYLHQERTLTIDFEDTFPYKILGWTEEDGGQRTTARLQETMNSAYWSQNANRFEYLRKDLGLE
ncbi:MAG: hypothetical protein AAF738_03385 [Bacteroidota bacterium]